MRITDLLQPESIALNSHPADKTAAIEQAVALMAAAGRLNDVSGYRDAVFAREAQGTTGVGEGIAIPHGKTAAVSTPGLSALVIPDGVDFDALDGAPVTLLFLIAAPDTKENVHLAVLSRLSTLLMDEAFTQRLRLSLIHIYAGSLVYWSHAITHHFSNDFLCLGKYIVGREIPICAHV